VYDSDCSQGEVMNQSYAKLLIFAFLLAGAAFNIAKGRQLVRSKKGSTLWGWVRIVVGVLMGLLPLPLIYFLRVGT